MHHKRRWFTRGLGAAVLLMAASMMLAPGRLPVFAQRPTLPPSWTPTFTPTATETFTPTMTPSPTHTLSPAEFCEAQFFTVIPGSGTSVPFTGAFKALVGSDAANTTLIFRLTHRLGGEQAVEEYPRPRLVNFEVPIRVLPRPGLYDWQFQLVDADGNVLCEESGYFFAGREEWVTPTATPTEAPPVVVVTATPQNTPTPIVIIVTATPEGFEPTPEPAIRERLTPTMPPTAITPDR